MSNYNSYNISKLMNDYPPLTSSEEHELISNNKHNPSKLKDLLVLHNIGLVAKTVHRDIKGYDDYRDDLISIGVGALINLADRFDPNRGVKFSSYAYSGIKRGILRYIDQNKEKYKKYYLQQPIKNRTIKDSDSKDFTVENLVYDLIDPSYRKVPSTETTTDENSFIEFGRKVVDDIKSMKNITARDKKIVLSFLYSGDDVTLEKIGKRYRVTGERIRQIVKKNIPKIKLRIKNKFGVTKIGQIT